MGPLPRRHDFPGPPAFGLSGVLPAMLRLAVSIWGIWAPHRPHDRLVNRRKFDRDLGNRVFSSFVDREPGTGGVAGSDPSRAGVVVALAGRRSDWSGNCSGVVLLAASLSHWRSILFRN